MRHLNLFLVPSAALLAGCDGFLGEPARVASVTIEPNPITLVENEWIPLKAVVRDGNGVEMPDQSVWWSSMNYNVAMPGAQMVPGVSGMGEGTTTIEAYVEDKVATATVTVTRGVVKSVVVNPNKFTLVPGQQAMLFPLAQDAKALPLRNRQATFSTSDPSITVNPQGVVRAVSPGLAKVTVTVDGVSAEVQLKVSQPAVSFDYYKRGGSTTPGTATLSFAPADINRGTLAIDGRSIPVFVSTSYDLGVTCLSSQPTASTPPDAITRCTFDSAPMTIRLCTPLNGISDPGQLQYVLMPQNDPGRVASTAAALLSAVQSNTTLLGINVYSSCAPNGGFPTPQRWVRNAPGTDFLLYPNTATVHPAASVAALLDGAAIFSAPGAGNDFKRYVAIRVSSTLFEVWH